MNGPGEAPLEPPRSPLRRSSKVPWIIAGLLVLLVAGALVVTLTRRAPPPAPPVAQPALAPEAEPVAPPPTAPARPARLEDVSAHPLYQRAIREGDVERRWAVVTDNLAEGVSPRKQLEFLAPSKPFSVEERGGATVISARSFQRYDAFAMAVSSVDVPVLLVMYRTMHLAIETAYRALGYPNASLDAVTVRALRRIVAAPVPRGDVRVDVAAGGVYTFADPALEDLGAVEKHLVRMGAHNERLIQQKAREILQSMGPVRVEKALPRKQ